MHLRAIAFDIDGTLYPNRVMFRNSLVFALSRPRLLYHFARVRRDIRRARPIDDFYGMQAELLARALGHEHDIDATSARIEKRIYHASERILERVSLYDGAEQLLGEIRNRGVRLGVMSDFPVNRKLKVLGIDQGWDCRICTEEVGYLKPNPEPFNALVECLGEAPENTLYVGNSYHYDIVGAARAGLKTAWLNDRPRRRVPAPPEGIEPDFMFSRYEQLSAWLMQQSGP